MTKRNGLAPIALPRLQSAVGLKFDFLFDFQNNNAVSFTSDLNVVSTVKNRLYLRNHALTDKQLVVCPSSGTALRAVLTWGRINDDSSIVFDVRLTHRHHPPQGHHGRFRFRWRGRSCSWPPCSSGTHTPGACWQRRRVQFSPHPASGQ